MPRVHLISLSVFPVTLAANLRKSPGPKFGLTITYPSPGVVERIGPDWDWIWIDGQHGELSYGDMLGLVRACDLVQRPAIVRVPANESGAIGQALDMGAAGVMVPLVNSAAEARAAVQAAKFPPLGQRSYGGRRPIDRHGRLYAERANTDTLLVVQIETPESLRNVDEIAAVPGVDVLFYSGDDMLMRLGGRMNEARPEDELESDLTRVASVCSRWQKLSGMAAYSPAMLARSLLHGYSLIAGGSDVGLLATSSSEAALRARNARQAGLGQTKSPANANSSPPPPNTPVIR